MKIDEALTKVEFSKDHKPVLAKEVLEAFEPLFQKNSLRYFDGTFGRGGHFLALHQCCPQMSAVLMDQDEEAIGYGKKYFQELIQSGKIDFRRGSFHQFTRHQLGMFDMILLDLGVSSPQIDKGERGFSFYHDGPLDMRMDQTLEITAADIINNMSEKELTQLFIEWGEVRRPHRVIRAILNDRKEKPFQTTRELAGLIERVDGWRVKGQHPATQYFMALRMSVNNELQGLEDSLPDLLRALNPEGRICVITFHSLEDRIVKNILRNNKNLGQPINKKVIIASEEECKQNPRARSAKLRIFERSSFDEPI